MSVLATGCGPTIQARVKLFRDLIAVAGDSFESAPVDDFDTTSLVIYQAFRLKNANCGAYGGSARPQHHSKEFLSQVQFIRLRAV